MHRWLFAVAGWTGLLFFGSIVAVSFASGLARAENLLGAPGETTLWYWVLLAASAFLSSAGVALGVLPRPATGRGAGRDEKATGPTNTDAEAGAAPDRWGT